MELILGVTTCDKCGEPMNQGQQIVVVGQSMVGGSNDELIVPDPEIRYACHLECWDEVELGY